MGQELSEAEAKVYDRQLRVWGVEVQKRLNAARILIAGCRSGLAAEVAKNIALAGVGSLSLLDDTPCSSGQAPCNFLIPADVHAQESVAAASAATLREMNPLVRIAALPGSLPSTPDPDFLRGFNVILLSSAPLSLVMEYDRVCREVGVAFFAASSRGSTSFFFVDLHSHTYSPLDVPAGTIPPQATSSFPSFKAALAHPWRAMRARYTHKLVYVLRVCAECELQNGRIPTAEDLSQLQQRARELAKAARAESLSDSNGSAASRDLIPEDVLPEGMLAEYVLGTSELPPVNAVMGGVLANEVLKAVSHKGEPINNFFFFSLEDNVGLIETLGG